MKAKLIFVVIAGTLTGISMANPNAAEVDQPAPAEATVSAADTINKEIKEFDTAYSAFIQKVRAEKNREAVRALYKDAPQPDPVIDRVLALVEKTPADKAAKKGLLWCQSRARHADHHQRISKIVAAHYMGDPILNQYTRALSQRSPNAEAELRAIIEKTTNKDTKIYASYYLANQLVKSRFSFKLSKEEKEAKAAESLKLMKQLNEYPEVAKLSPKMAKRIASIIFEKENLSIGCTAPEIEGDDHTGTVFKLSDYRGKVVLLDFWGIW